VTSPNFSNGIGASVTTFAATAIVIADMVGVGVFTSLGFQVQTIDLGRYCHDD
jgi:APA family basic amino acid/polyamine antiporter